MTAQGGILAASGVGVAVELIELQRWARSALPGDRIIYAQGTSLPRHPVIEEVRSMIDRGEVSPCQIRQPYGSDYVIQRRAVADPIAVPERRLSTTIEGDEEFDRVMRALRRVTNFGRVCPTDAELARSCEIGTGKSAADRVNYLIRLGVQRQIIRVVDRRPKRRLVTFVATGRSSAED